MKYNYRLVNNITGWIVFAIAAATYLLTMEPTASLWDCGEFIATAFKLEVGHPPGAPFFMICTRVFGLLAGGNPATFAVMVNTFSALMSAFTILFLFWTITHLVRKMVSQSGGEMSLPELILVMGCGVVGALAYTFSDTFWFSAVEGEVYASSSFFTAIVFWAILKWEEQANHPHANKWLILIAYLMGLSIGVHLLNLLAIPAIVMVYYFNRYPVTRKGVILALLTSVLILAFVMYGIIQGLITVASWFELAFVNGFGAPFNTGIVVYALLILGGLIYGIYYTHRTGKALWNTAFVSVLMIIIGYASYAMIVVRSLAEPPINENRPSNVFNLLSYLNREQYGDRPLLYGQYYNAPPVDMKEGKKNYAPVNGRYEVVGTNPEYVYDERFCTIFPRMYSSESSHVTVYKEWGDVKGKPVKIKDPRTGEEKTEYVPRFSENLRFFFSYQLGFMYFRYFMWNFVGRQNDTQSFGEIQHGNWISGIPFIDEMMLGNQKELPPHMKNVPSRNTYYFLPLLLGLVGLFFHLNRHAKDFWVVMLLFVMTGIAIVVYLNQTPNQPRERDYAYAGSFYAFAIWIGIGVMAVYHWLDKYLKKQTVVRSVAVSGICLLAVPVLMASENWDDHDRSGRYATRAYASDYLNSCAPNAILFTYGDNDTFPLWYAQEVEGIRTDVRVVNTMLLNTDWYIHQMQRKAYQSDPLPISMTEDKYLYERRGVVYLFDRSKEYVNLKDALQFVLSDDPATKRIPEYGDQPIDYIPVKNFYLDVNPADVLASGTVSPEDSSFIVRRIQWRIGKNYLTKAELAMMDILIHNQWKRPVYFASPSPEGCLGLQEYLQSEGIVSRLVPIKTPCSSGYDCGRVHTDLTYKNLMEKFDWGRLNEPDVYIDHFHTRTVQILRIRQNFGKLAEVLLNEGRKDSARNVIHRCLQMLPSSKVPHDFGSLKLFEGCYRTGDTALANQLVEELFTQTTGELKYYFSLKPKFIRLSDYEIRRNLQTLQELLFLTQRYGQKEWMDKIDREFNLYYQKYSVLNAGR